MQHERFTEPCTVYFKQTEIGSFIPPVKGKTAPIDSFNPPNIYGLYIDVGNSIGWIAPDGIGSIEWEKNA